MAEDMSSDSEIQQLRRDIADLYNVLQLKEERLRQLESSMQAAKPAESEHLTNTEIEIYSRQLVMPDFGVQGQLKLKNASVLVVGIGGLGCPAAQYLAAAGCGRLGLVDYDVVDRTNLHRQTLHRNTRLNLAKVESARYALQETNSECRIDTFNEGVTSRNALDLIKDYDVILDCTDNMPTRYLLNDACVFAGKPLISGSALQMDGQLTVYHYGPQCPCYRCLFPVPTPPENVTNCGDGGVLGAITGVIGSMQALEAVKLLTGVGDVLAGRLLIFDGTRSVFRTIKLRPRRPNCDICSEQRIITELIDYEEFCSMRSSDKYHGLTLLPPERRVNVQALKEMYDKDEEVLLLDVRPPHEFEICQLPKSMNLPLKKVLDDGYLQNLEEEFKQGSKPIIVICRRGNDSQIAVEHMRNKFPERSIYDLEGGLHAYHYKVDTNFPIY